MTPPDLPLENVLLIVVDQWRGEALGHLGAAHALTPNLDRLAARGVSFARHFAQAAPCGPARVRRSWATPRRRATRARSASTTSTSPEWARSAKAGPRSPPSRKMIIA